MRAGIVGWRCAELRSACIGRNNLDGQSARAFISIILFLDFRRNQEIEMYKVTGVRGELVKLIVCIF